MSNSQSAKERALVLKQLRTDHVETVEQTQAQLKEQQQFRKKLREAMKNGAGTIPEVAAVINQPEDLVLWHMVTMKKYDLVHEVTQDGEFYRYALTEEKPS